MFTATETVILNFTYAINNVSQTKTKDRGWIAEITFDKIDSNGTSVGTEVVSKEGAEYNDFWANYTNGAYLFELLKQKLGLSVDIPAEIEGEFLNNV